MSMRSWLYMGTDPLEFHGHSSPDENALVFSSPKQKLMASNWEQTTPGAFPKCMLSVQGCHNYPTDLGSSRSLEGTHRAVIPSVWEYVFLGYQSHADCQLIRSVKKVEITPGVSANPYFMGDFGSKRDAIIARRSWQFGRLLPCCNSWHLETFMSRSNIDKESVTSKLPAVCGKKLDDEPGAFPKYLF